TQYSREKHLGWKDGVSSYRNAMLRNNESQECKFCKEVDVRVLVVHHVDEDRTNNKLENLCWLCHNCHHLVHHCKGESEKIRSIIGKGKEQ
ncbi:MAG: hypothetical protein WEC58_03005, partial [Candidatus Paceibacterota bacterium]